MCTFVDFLIRFGEVVRIDVTGFVVIVVAAGDGFLDFAADFARVMTVGPDDATMGFAATTRLAAGDGFLDFVADFARVTTLGPDDARAGTTTAAGGGGGTTAAAAGACGAATNAS